MQPTGFILPSRIIGLFFLLPAIGSAALAIWFYTSASHFLSHATSVPGIVTALKPSTSSDGTTYLAEFEYTDTAGQKRNGVSSWSSNPPRYAVGDAVEVLYLPIDPKTAQLRSFGELWLGTLICSILVVPPLVASAIFLWLIPFTIRRVWPAKEALRPA
ncbi:MAG: hypothetical protein JWM57_2367 [Phycisphaerales bacterium]|nr:hypothetical protein [Phycisphaerales bacterium]